MQTNSMAAQPTTTEELIVQYLDGELVRKELETVLFDRLAHSEEARLLLREYLTLRGAIRMSHEDERFQLSEELDSRTRTRIEQMIEAMEPEIASARGFLPNKSRVASSATARRTTLWARRGAYASLAVLLLIGAWFLGQHESTTSQTVQKPFASVQPQPALTPEQTVIAPHESVEPKTVAVPKVYSAHLRKQASIEEAAHTPSASVVQSPQNHEAVQPASSDQDVMLSQRFAKAINSAKNEVVVSSRDRL